MGSGIPPDDLASMVKNGQSTQLREYGGTESLAAKLNCADVKRGLDPATTDFTEIQRLYGKNELEPPFVPRYLSLIWEGLQDVTILLLVAAAIVSLVLGIAFEEDKSTSWIEGAAILVAVTFVINFQAWTDYNNAITFRRQFYELEEAKRVTAVRGGSLVQIHPSELVVGDVLRLETGAIVPADGVLIEGRALKMDEAALTGESKHVSKTPFDMNKPITTTQTPFILSGTNVVHGEGNMFVVAVGAKSLQGRILSAVMSQNHPNGDSDDDSGPVTNESTSKRTTEHLAVVKESDDDKEVQVELPQMDATFAQRSGDSRVVSLRSTQFSIRSDRHSTARSARTVDQHPISGRYSRFCCAARSSGKDTGGTLTEKLDQVAIDIGKFGFLIGIVVFVVMCIRWSVEEFANDGQCPLFNGNFTLCSSAHESLGCTMDIALNDTCNREWNGAKDINELLRFFITAVTILVVVVPEGLPLAVTLSLSLSMRRMAKENNQVKNMDSSETMGSATTICTDKTGTLTENRMTCVRVLFAQAPEKVYQHDDHNNNPLGDQLANVTSASLLFTACALGTSPTSNVDTGNATDRALLRVSQSAKFDWQATRAKFAQGDNSDWAVFRYPFSSTRKRQSVVVRNPEMGGFRVYSIGAPQYILDSCNSTMSDSQKTQMAKALEDFAHDALRTVMVAYKDVASADEWDKPALGYNNKAATDEDEDEDQVLLYAAEQDLTLIALLGIEDPLRPGIRAAIDKCYKAGVDVRMCTGDSLETAVAIALQCGILRDNHMEQKGNGRFHPKPLFAMTGAEFDERIHERDNDKPLVWRRAFDFKTGKFGQMKAPPFKVDPITKQRIVNRKRFDEIWPKLRVLARCLPEDKLNLVRELRASEMFRNKSKVAQLRAEFDIAIFPDYQVVAVTGDGTNDAPALRAADVGFAMGIAGTDIAKQACDIILLDDNFASIVTAIKWGRNVFDSISKFVQFQLTVNLVAVVVACVGAFAFSQSPLGPVQMLWVNLIMDSFASFALATDPPTEDVLERPPYGKRRPVVSREMTVNIVGQASLQIAILMALLFDATWIPTVDWSTGGVQQYPPPSAAVLHEVETNSRQVTETVSEHWTIIFNTFVMLQLANQINCRKLQTADRLKYSFQEWNPFHRIASNWLFLLVISVELIGQIIIVQLAGKTFAVTALGFSQWVFCVGLGAASFPFQWVLNLVILLVGKGSSQQNAQSSPAVANSSDLVVKVAKDSAHEENV